MPSCVWLARRSSEKAKKAYAEKKYGEAQQHLRFAARTLQWGFQSLTWYKNRLEKGAARAEAGIKVSAAVATMIVSAPLELGVLGTAGLAAYGEGAQQGTTLIAKGLDSKQTVSSKELRDAAMEVAIAGGSAGLGKGFAKLAGKALAAKTLARILKRSPTKAQLEWAAKRIETYVATNAAAISKKMLKLDTDPDWNWWAMIVAPAIDPAAVELVKENEVPRTIRDGI